MMVRTDGEAMIGVSSWSGGFKSVDIASCWCPKLWAHPPAPWPVAPAAAPLPLPWARFGGINSGGSGAAVDLVVKFTGSGTITAGAIVAEATGCWDSAGSSAAGRSAAARLVDLSRRCSRLWMSVARTVAVAALSIHFCGGAAAYVWRLTSLSVPRHIAIAVMLSLAVPQHAARLLRFVLWRSAARMCAAAPARELPGADVWVTIGRRALPAPTLPRPRARLHCAVHVIRYRCACYQTITKVNANAANYPLNHTVQSGWLRPRLIVFRGVYTHFLRGSHSLGHIFVSPHVSPRLWFW